MTEWATMRNYRLWVGMALMALSIYLIIKLYDNLFLSLRVPIVAVGPDGVLKVIGSIRPFTSPVLAYDIVLSMVLTAILSSLASVLIYSSITSGRYRSNPAYQGSLVVGMDDHDKAITALTLSNLEKRALQVIRKRGGMITQAELGRELGLSKYQVSRLVKRLEAKGIIERRRAGVTNILILRNGLNTLGNLSKNKD
ncbi:helix-turn-helix transcriptional regulator [Vulcanisaeta distributa]|uniref:Transcriptional regulator, MarR family n=1 Tax=Vulcanisaeta distributa (strain DSM 14429 / JCM 11212 / NBRC 100878 / IC-017) TaxID=572478 RepID=E1QQ09_VULDI|nr:MarR family transcriptional regulator [Vulcanisaeta distributa]ADN50381.1 transcriptional regulator, MarR family [Vulcanisaeta distributa DSM 14429]